KQALEFIENNLNYDMGLIWKNIIRLENQADFKKRMQLNYILSSKLPLKKEENRLSAALILHIYYEELAEYCAGYVESMPDGTDVYITVPDEKTKSYVEKVFSKIQGHEIEIRIVGNIGRDVAPFLVGCKDIISKYDLICKIHDKKVCQIMPMSIGESWAYKCFENLLKNRIFVNNIITTFENNPYLGLLTPPVPHHGPYYPTCGKGEWGDNFTVTEEVARHLGVKVNMDETKEPIAPLGSMFWFRTKALKGLFAHDWDYSEFPQEPIQTDATILHAIERVYPFCVQQEGYYPAWIMADSYARIEFTNWNFINGELHKEAMKKVGINKHRELLERIREL
ncbi:MAG: rhamnan synthesis F family protein, partial [Longicatena sp.]